MLRGGTAFDGEMVEICVAVVAASTELTSAARRARRTRCGRSGHGASERAQFGPVERIAAADASMPDTAVALTISPRNTIDTASASGTRWTSRSASSCSGSGRPTSVRPRGQEHPDRFVGESGRERDVDEHLPVLVLRARSPPQAHVSQRRAATRRPRRAVRRAIPTIAGRAGGGTDRSAPACRRSSIATTATAPKCSTTSRWAVLSAGHLHLVDAQREDRTGVDALRWTGSRIRVAEPCASRRRYCRTRTPRPRPRPRRNRRRWACRHLRVHRPGSRSAALYFSAAATNAANSGCGRVGRLLSSGWAWVANEERMDVRAGTRRTRPGARPVRCRRTRSPDFGDPVAVGVVDLVAVTVSLGHLGRCRTPARRSIPWPAQRGTRRDAWCRRDRLHRRRRRS